MTGITVVGDAGVLQHLPALLDLVEGRHVGHRAAGGEVGQHHLLVVGGEDVGGLGHEVHAAEHDVVGLGALGGLLRELERVAGDVGELDDLVALVVVAEDEDLRAELVLGGPGPRDQRRVAGRRQVAGAVDAALAAGSARGRASAAAQGSRSTPSGRSSIRSGHAGSLRGTRLHRVTPTSPRHGQFRTAGRAPGRLRHARADRPRLLRLDPDRARGRRGDAPRAGWPARPTTSVVLAPLSDGGPGFVDVLAAALGGERGHAHRRGPAGASRSPATYLRSATTAYVEAAQACGLHLLTAAERDPLHATTDGVGELSRRARRGRRPGSSSASAVRRPTTAAPACSPRSASTGSTLPASGLRPAGGRCRRRPPRPRAACTRGWPRSSCVAASDVDNPLLGLNGASAVFGPQKGAADDEVQRLDARARRTGPTCCSRPARRLDVRGLEGAGAAGGLGYGAAAARRHPGLGHRAGTRRRRAGRAGRGVGPRGDRRGHVRLAVAATARSSPAWPQLAIRERAAVRRDRRPGGGRPAGDGRGRPGRGLLARGGGRLGRGRDGPTPAHWARGRVAERSRGLVGDAGLCETSEGRNSRLRPGWSPYSRRPK